MAWVKLAFGAIFFLFEGRAVINVATGVGKKVNGKRKKGDIFKGRHTNRLGER